jgi:hypothetical protein
MTPTEKRIKDQIDRWLTSLELHRQYLDLNDLAYNRIQPWPVHDRPTRLVLDLAKQKTLELKALLDSRLAMGDAKFADALELMAFLANLVGSQNLQRFIPLADPERQTAPLASPPAPQSLTETIEIKREPPKSHADSATVIKPRAPVQPIAPTPTAPPPSAQPDKAAADDDATREMPRPVRPSHAHAAAPNKSDAVKAVAKSESRKPAGRPSPVRAKPSGKPAVAKAGDLQSQIVIDAVRLLNWGRPWHELAETIARMADRPPIAEIRRVLRSNRADIERRAAEPQS